MESDQLWQQYAARFQVESAPFLSPPVHHPDMIICIPAYAERNIPDTLNSLQACAMPQVEVEVIIFANIDSRATSADKTIHEHMSATVGEWLEKSPSHLKTHLISYPSEDKKWGVGWARKKLLDEAARRMHSDGILVCLDADCRVDANYLTAIWNYFQTHVQTDAASIYFEHDLSSASNPHQISSIIQYELHLRYLVAAKRWAGHPFSRHTVGSAMAVRRNAYLLQGGMNTRQAGEDFYFLHKFIETGRFGEISDTRVIPSARISKRVPFGTGRAMQHMVDEKRAWETISFESIRILRQWIASLATLYNFLERHKDREAIDQDIIALTPSLLHDFLEKEEYGSKCRSIHQHTSGFDSFRNRWFRVFGIFQMIKATHYLRDHFYPNTSVCMAANTLAMEAGWIRFHLEEIELLDVYRQQDRLRNGSV